MQSNGLATILLMIPILTVPALAIFGIPQFAPVVASPLDEGSSPNRDREKRVGDSARHSRDDLFNDAEDFGSEPGTKSDISYGRRELEGKGRGRLSPKRDASIPSWATDLESESEWPGTPRGNLGVVDDVEARPEGSSQQPLNKRPRAVPSGKVQPRRGAGARIASSSEISSSIIPAGFSDEREDPEQNRAVTRAEGRPVGQPHSSQQREPQADPLTWQSAVERLNQLDIRNFRLEPGHKAGLFVFICSYTPADTPRVTYRFEAGADEPLKAVEKVLEQIVEWQQRR